MAFIRWKLQGVVRYSAGRSGGNSERFLNLEMVGPGGPDRKRMGVGVDFQPDFQPLHDSAPLRALFS